MPRRAPLPLARARVRDVAGRALRLRCPRCGQAPLFAGAWRMHERCGACGLRYEREQGYFVGAIYVNYAVTVLVTLGAVLGLDGLVGLTLGWQLAIGLGLATLLPLVVFRHARSLWLALGHLVRLADERHAPAGSPEPRPGARRRIGGGRDL